MIEQILLNRSSSPASKGASGSEVAAKHSKQNGLEKSVVLRVKGAVDEHIAIAVHRLSSGLKLDGSDGFINILSRQSSFDRCGLYMNLAGLCGGFVIANLGDFPI